MAEIGIRLALGAARRDVLSLVLGREALITVAGLVPVRFRRWRSRG